MNALFETKEEEMSWMSRAMQVYGGGFVKSLLECMGHADSSNLQRLLNAFPEIVERYTALGKIMKAREDGKK